MLFSVVSVCTCEDQLDDCVIEPTTVMLDSLQRIDRCLRVLENVSHMTDVSGC